VVVYVKKHTPFCWAAKLPLKMEQTATEMVIFLNKGTTLHRPNSKKNTEILRKVSVFLKF